MEDYSNVVDLFADKSKRAETKKGLRFSLAQADVEKHLAAGGIKKDVVNRMKELQTGLINGAAQFGQEALTGAIKEAKKNGDDASGLKVEMVINTAQGPDKVIVHAQRSHNNPSNPGHKVTTHGDVQLTSVRKRMIDKEVAEGIADMVSKVMG